MKKNKILFFDIDGTLLDEHTQVIPESTKLALINAKKNGHKIIINTGRPKSTLEDFIFELNPDGFVCGCGTYVEFNNKILHHTTIDSHRCKQLLNDVLKYNIDAILEGKDHVYFTPKIKHQDLLDVETRFKKTNFIVKSIEDEFINFDKFAMWFNDSIDINSFKSCISDFDRIIRDKDFWEIVPMGCSKATGIQVLLDYLNLDIKDSYGFGDSYNDLPMLEYVGTSIVMGNAKEDLKQIASFVTKDINDNGIHFAMTELELI